MSKLPGITAQEFLNFLARVPPLSDVEEALIDHRLQKSECVVFPKKLWDDMVENDPSVQKYLRGDRND